MDDRFSILSQQVFNKSLSDFSVDELVAVTEQNPYFTAAQILLLKKLDKGSEAYNSQYQKAILYYHDPVAFDYLVHREEFETEVLTETNADNEQVRENIESTEAVITDIEIAGDENADDVETYMDEMRSGSSIEQEEKIDLEKSEQIQLDEIIEELSLEEKINSADNLYDDEQTEIISENKEPVEESNYSKHETEVLERDQFVQEPGDNEDITEPHQDKLYEETEPVHLAGDDQNINEPSQEIEAPHIPSLPSLKEMKETDLVFEPFHTVDYFASQGIKISQEEAPKDKFGKQLKSFTEWLKTMKRLPAAEIASSVERSSEQKIENLAADSVNSADVVTEAMAEVWLRQGNKEKAIEIYNKLILLYPSKSAYFAAKIDSLKKQI
jgi:BMFP domain-containing protein YqiC